MITTVDNVKKLLGINDSVKDYEIEEKLKSLEITIRNLTNNKFLENRIRSYREVVFNEESKKIISEDFLKLGFRKGDTIDIEDAMLNRGIFTITETTDESITISENLLDEKATALITKIKYPYDIIQGVVKLIQYDFRMNDKIGIKEETISRYAAKYYDINSSESVEGYPAALMKFLDKYKKLRWS